MNQHISLVYSKTTLFLMILMSFLNELTLMVKSRYDFQSFVTSMINTHKSFPILSPYQKALTCLEIFKGNKKSLTISFNDKLQKKGKAFLMRIGCLAKASSIV